MNGRWLPRLLAILVSWPALVCAQVALAPPVDASQLPPQAIGPRPSREFPEFRGTWVLDESAGKGRIVGLPLARKLVIATTPTELSLVKDACVSRR